MPCYSNRLTLDKSLLGIENCVRALRINLPSSVTADSGLRSTQVSGTVTGPVVFFHFQEWISRINNTKRRFYLKKKKKAQEKGRNTLWTWTEKIASKCSMVIQNCIEQKWPHRKLTENNWKVHIFIYKQSKTWGCRTGGREKPLK